MKKSKIPTMITGWYKQREKNEHYIWIKQTHENGETFYSKFMCFNPDFYTNMMKREFDIKKV